MNNRFELGRVQNKIMKSLTVVKLKNQIHSISLMLVFCIFASIMSVVLNHNGRMLSYGFFVAGVSLLLLAFFLSLRIKMQVKLNNTEDDYGKMIVEPLVKYFFQGSFSRKGGLTEREILVSSLFSDSSRYMYDSKHEIKGSYKGVSFENSDMRERHSDDENVRYGRIFTFHLNTENVNPVIFKYINAPDIYREDSSIHRVGVNYSDVSSRYEVYAFDQREVEKALNDELAKKLMGLLSLELGNSLKISFYNGKIYVYFDTQDYTFKKSFTRKDDPAEEIHRVCQELELICSIVEVMV